MKKEVCFYNDISAKAYLRQLISIYPYDIEESLVFSLLDKSTYPQPAILQFVHYVRTIFKIHIIQKESMISPSLQRLMEKMSHMSLQSGSLLHLHQFTFDATYRMKTFHLVHPYAHLPLSQIPFLVEAQLHTLPIIPMSEYHSDIPLVYSQSFIYKNISMDASNFIAICIKIADKTGIIFLSLDCLSMALALSAMYPIQEPKVSYDFLIIFGLQTKEMIRSFYIDKTNSLSIGLLAGNTSIYHFLYLKEMILTLYNAICIQKHDLPIHASMIELQKDKEELHVIFAGRTCSGKSEMLDAMKVLCRKRKIPSQSYYDDSGILHYLDNVIVSTGSEVSACKDITFQKKTMLFTDISDSLFLKEGKRIHYQITPLTTHEKSLEFHPVNVLCLLDSSASHKGIFQIKGLKEALDLFLKEDDQVFFYGTSGIPYLREEVLHLITDFFTALFINNIPIYHISTKGSSYQKESLFDQLAQQLINTIL